MTKVDWTGVTDRDEPVAPLSAETFELRLRLLSARDRDLLILRDAMQKQGQPKQ
jgi:hypothetical protein